MPVFPKEEIPGPLYNLIDEAPILTPSMLGGFGSSALAVMCGKAAVHMPDGELENAIIWSVVIDESGLAKSPSFKRAISPVRSLELDLEIDATITMEALMRLLADSTGDATGLIASDELSGFLRGIGQYKSGGVGSDRSKFMELWNSGYRSPYQRVGGSKNGTLGVDLNVRDPVLSVCGGLTRSSLGLLGNEEDGFRARWLPFVSDSKPGEFETSPVSPEWSKAIREDGREHKSSSARWNLGRAGLEARSRRPRSGG